MTELLTHLRQFLGKPGEVVAWGSAVATLGSASAYGVGYLSVRFKLTALGLGTDLDVLDERYLFEGLKFAVFLGASLPPLAASFLVLAGLFLGVRRAASSARAAVGRWWQDSMLPLLFGIIVSLGLIQFVLRQCFLFDNLLLRESLPDPGWYRTLLTSAGGGGVQLFFLGALVGLAVPLAILLSVRSWSALSFSRRACVGMLITLLVVQALLLPVNYGILTGVRFIPRLAPRSGPTPDSKKPTWLIWEGAKTTYLTGDDRGPKLVTVPAESTGTVTIEAFDTLETLRAALHPSQPPEEPSGAKPPEPTESIWGRLARVTGIAATPQTMREEVPEPGEVRGDIFLMSVADGLPSRLSETGDFHSPVFSHDSETLFALRQGSLMQQRLSADRFEEVVALPEVVKLLGVDRRSPRKLLYLAGPRDNPRVMELDLDSLASRPVPGTLPSEQRLYLLGEERSHDGICVYVQEATELPRKKWTDVFVRLGDKAPRNRTQGDGVSHRQPALSPDGRRVAFVRVAGSR